MRQARYRFFLLPLFFVLICVGAFAQANSELTGIVTDQTGAAVAGAQIVVVDPATGFTRATASGGTGLYSISGLNPANYNLRATAKGFQALAHTYATSWKRRESIQSGRASMPLPHNAPRRSP